jgi:hypothetical protein
MNGFTAKRLDRVTYEYRGIRISWKREYRSRVVSGYSLPAEYRFTIDGVKFAPRLLADAKNIIDASLEMAA